jgi:hypothetical protein
MREGKELKCEDNLGVEVKGEENYLVLEKFIHRGVRAEFR